jgi:putative NADH-flavin reductase
MKIAIFGATGSVGRLAVEQALEQRHTVTALVRDPEKVETRHENLRLIKGDVLTAADTEETVKDQDAILCILGAGRKGIIRSEGTKNIIAAMQKSGVKRLICQSSIGVGDSRENLNFWWKYVMFGMLLRPAYADHVLQEDYVMKSGLDWTIIRPAEFTDGPLTGIYKHGFSGTAEGLTLKISRADVAGFLIKQLTDNTYLHRTPGLSY